MTTDPDRIRETIARNQGHYAPAQPVQLCGPPDGTEYRADWTSPLPRIPLRHRIANRIGNAIICTNCLLPWIVPGHKLRGCRNGTH